MISHFFESIRLNTKKPSAYADGFFAYSGKEGQGTARFFGSPVQGELARERLRGCSLAL